MKITSAATVAFVFCNLLSVCCTDDARPLFKRAATSGSNTSGAAGGASSPKNSTSEALPTDKTTNSDTGVHGGNQATSPTQKPAHIPNGATSAGSGSEPSCGSLHDHLSPSCFNASWTVQQLLMSINDGTAIINPATLTAISSTIQTYCNSSCIVPVLDYYECTQDSDMANGITGFICGELHGQYCPIIVANGILNQRLPVEDVEPSCMASTATACPSDCNRTLSTITSALECCTQGAVQLGIVGKSDLYEACAIQLPEPCSPSTPNTTTSTAGAGLHKAATAVSLVTAVSVFAISWLFK